MNFKKNYFNEFIIEPHVGRQLNFWKTKFFIEVNCTLKWIKNQKDWIWKKTYKTKFSVKFLSGFCLTCQKYVSWFVWTIFVLLDYITFMNCIKNCKCEVRSRKNSTIISLWCSLRDDYVDHWYSTSQYYYNLLISVLWHSATLFLSAVINTLALPDLNRVTP